MAGYSGKPLEVKLGYRPGQRALIVGLPESLAWLGDFPVFARCEVRSAGELADLAGPFDLVHLFETEAVALEAALPRLKALIAPAGTIWVSWPKKAAKRPTTLSEDRIRAIALACGLVDVKVCAVDAVWSGLKLVIPRAQR